MKNYLNGFTYACMCFLIGTMIYNSYLQYQVEKEKLDYYKQAVERQDRVYQETMKLLLDTQQKVIGLENK